MSTAARQPDPRRPFRTMLVADDALLRARMREHLQQAYAAIEISERRTLNDSQVVWDLRAHEYDLLLLESDSGDNDVLEFVASLTTREHAHTAIVIVTSAEHAASIHAMDIGVFDFVDRNDMSVQSLKAMVERVHDRIVHAVAHGLPPADELVPPELAIKGFRPLTTLSVTSESCVVLVQHRRDVRKYVLKFLPGLGNNDRLVKRFLQECRIATTQKHNNLVTVFEQGLSAGAAYYVMEYLPHGSLQDVLQRVRLPAQKAVKIVLQIAVALEHLHSNNITHLDVKSANVLFRDRNTAVLIDFGAARNQLLNRSYTLKDHAIGTPHYMSPEQATGKRLDHRADLYALGVVFFELLTGNCPYTGDTISEVLYRHLRDPIPQLPGETRAYQPILDGTLAKRPRERFKSAGEMARTLYDIYRAERGSRVS